MNTTISSKPVDFNINKITGVFVGQRVKVFGFIIIGALLAFEMFNYSTTEFALSDVLGSLTFMSIRWSTILAIAFCGIDFAGIARLFTPEQTTAEPTEVWYLFGAWLLAAAMNATLTWWGVSVAIANHISQGAAIINSETIQTVVPIFVAVMVWIIRVMIIGTFSLSGERMFGQVENRQRRVTQPTQQQSTVRNEYIPQRPVSSNPQPIVSRPALTPAANFKPQARTSPRTENTYSRPAEPTYHNLANDRQPGQFGERE